MRVCPHQPNAPSTRAQARPAIASTYKRVRNVMVLLLRLPAHRESDGGGQVVGVVGDAAVDSGVDLRISAQQETQSGVGVNGAAAVFLGREAIARNLDEAVQPLRPLISHGDRGDAGPV